MTRRSPAVEQVIRLLEENPQRIASLTAGLTPAQLRLPPGPDEWSANEVLAHLRSCADVWGGYIKTMLDQDAPRIRAVSPRGWVNRTDYREQEFGSSWQAFVAQRTELLRLLEPLVASDWARGASVTRSGKPTNETVLSYAERLAEHERHHVEQFARIAGTMRQP